MWPRDGRTGPGWVRLGAGGVALLAAIAALGVSVLGAAVADASLGSGDRAAGARESAPAGSASAVGTLDGDRGARGVVTGASFLRQMEDSGSSDDRWALKPTPGALVLVGVAGLAAFGRRGTSP